MDAKLPPDTIDEILLVEPEDRSSREKDALLARFFVGWLAVWRGQRGGWVGYEKDSDLRQRLPNPVPHYFSNNDDAIRLLDHCRKLGVEVELSCTRHSITACLYSVDYTHHFINRGIDMAPAIAGVVYNYVEEVMLPQYLASAQSKTNAEEKVQ